ncbi:MAG TPA: diacylglycerol kinase family protein [Anaerolineae bacterium]|nr:diacylglycerol kinase family protein [Anaerolineae bacterium]
MPATFVIVNPASGGGKTGQRWRGLDARMRAEGAQYDVEFTREPGHAEQLARQAALAGVPTLLIVGGDGTLNEVVNGLIQDDRPLGEITIGILPVGTGSDFARALGLPRDVLAAAIHLLRRAQPEALDVGRVDCARGGQPATRYFVNIAGLGFDGEVADRVNRAGKSGGTLVYQSMLLRGLVTYRNKHVRLSIDGAIREGMMNSVVVANARYFGGGMFVAPNAHWADGLFDVIVLGDFGKLEVVANLPRLYRGTHLTHKKVTELRGREVRVEAQERMFLQAEGELVGEAPATFTILPKALKVLR